MTRISTGTVSIGNGETIFTLWDGDDDVVLSEITAPAQSAVVIEGVANFIKTRLSTTSAELVLPHSGAGGVGLACAISALTPTETQIGTLNARTARVIQELETVEANGRGLFYRFSDTTTDADPGAGYIRFNQLDLTTATAAYIDVLDANGGTVSGEIDTWDDSTSLTKGNLWVRSIAEPSAFRAYGVTGSVVDGAGYRKLTLAHIDGSGSFAADDELMVAFARTGDRGDGYITDATVADPTELTALEGEDAGYLVFVTDLQTDFGAYSGRSGVVELITGPDWELVAVYTGLKGDTGDQGDKGWSPQIVVVEDGTRRVHQLTGYVGGAGTAPTANVGEYLKGDGTFTATIGDAADVRGPAGLNGSGTVASVEAGANISVDNTDPTAPVVSAPTAVRFDAQALGADQKGQARANIGADVLAGFRNKLMNGNFDIWQRGTSFSVAGLGADRWNHGFGGGTGTVSQAGHAAGDGYGDYYLLFTQTSAGTLPFISQKVESVRTFSGKRVTLSWLATGGVVSPSLRQNFGSGGSALNDFAPTATGTRADGSHWATFDVPTIAGKTIGPGSNLEAIFYLPSGTTFAMALWRISLVEGDATAEADPFSPRHLQQELALCQRYYEERKFRRYLTGTIWNTTGGIIVQEAFCTPKRVTPTVILSNAETAYDGIWTGRTATGPAATPFEVAWTINYGGSTSAYDAIICSTFWTADAEL